MPKCRISPPAATMPGGPYIAPVHHRRRAGDQQEVGPLARAAHASAAAIGSVRCGHCTGGSIVPPVPQHPGLGGLRRCPQSPTAFRPGERGEHQPDAARRATSSPPWRLIRVHAASARASTLRQGLRMGMILMVATISPAVNRCIASGRVATVTASSTALTASIFARSGSRAATRPTAAIRLTRPVAARLVRQTRAKQRGRDALAPLRLPPTSPPSNRAAITGSSPPARNAAIDRGRVQHRAFLQHTARCSRCVWARTAPSASASGVGTEDQASGAIRGGRPRSAPAPTARSPAP